MRKQAEEEAKNMVNTKQAEEEAFKKKLDDLGLEIHEVINRGKKKNINSNNKILF